MRSSLEQMERIAQYLSGTLSPQDRADFEADVAGDPLLQEQLGFQQDIHRIMQRRALRSEINTVAKHYGGSSTSFSWMAMAVSGIVVVAGVTGFLLFSSGKEQQPAKPAAAQQTEAPETHTNTTTDAAADPQRSFHTEQAVLPYRFVGPYLSGYVEGSLTPESMEQAASMGIASVSDQARTQAYNFVSDLDELDFLPEGFSAEALTMIPADERKKWGRAELNELYYSLGSTQETVVTKEDNGYITVRSWRKPLRMHIPGVFIKHSDYKSKAFGIVVDDKGDALEHVEIEFLAYGDKKKVTTDASGRFTFELYGRIATEATFTVPGYGTTTLPKAQFQSGKQTWFQVEVSGGAKEEGRVNEKTLEKTALSYDLKEEQIAVDGSCSLSPAAVKALRSPEFLGTYIATKDFEKRIKALHMLDNGQELLDLYVDNITQPLWKVDQLIAGRLTGESKKLFEGFGVEHSESTIPGLKDQAYYSGIYRDKRYAFEQQITIVGQNQNNKKLTEHMKEFVAPCTQ